MTSPAPAPRTMSEICADSRIFPFPDGGFLLNTDGRRGFSLPAQTGGGMPQITSMRLNPGALDSPRLEAFLNRLLRVPEAADWTGHVPDPGVKVSIDELVTDANTLGYFVQTLAADVELPPDFATTPIAKNRVVPLDADGRVTTLGNAHSLRVIPTSSLAAGAYANVTPQVARIWSAKPGLNGRMVNGPDGVQLGQPGGLAAQWYGPTLADFGRPLDRDDIATAGAQGATTVPVDGYVDLIRLMENVPSGTQALITVDGGGVFLSHRDDNGVSLLDPVRPGTVNLPHDPSEIRFTQLPGTMPLDARLDALNDARYGGGGQRLSFPISRPVNVESVRAVDGNPDLAVLVVGDGAKEPAAVLDRLFEAVQKFKQPMIVLSVDNPGDTPSPAKIASVRTLVNQYRGWGGKSPMVFTRGQQLDPGQQQSTGDLPVVGPEVPGFAAGAPAPNLLDILDDLAVPLFQRVPMPSQRGSGALVNLGPSWGWRSRQPGAPLDGGAIIEGDVPPMALLQDALDQRKQPAVERPSAAAVDYLSKPLATSTFDFTGPGVKTLRPQVEQLAGRDPAFAAHAAALQLADLGHQATVTTFLKGGPTSGLALFTPLANAPGATLAERQDHVQALLPHLASLSGGDAVGSVTSLAVKATLTAINDANNGTKSFDQIKKEIDSYRRYLPKEGSFRTVLTEQVRAIAPNLANVSADQIVDIAEMIMTCP